MKGLLVIETVILIFVLVLSFGSVPEAKLKTTDHFSCDMQGSLDQGPVQVQFLADHEGKRILVLKTEAKTGTRRRRSAPRGMTSATNWKSREL